MGLSPPPSCSEAYQDRAHHQESRGFRYYCCYVHRPGAPSAGNEYVGNEDVAEIIRDGQCCDVRIGNSKGESRKCGSGAPIAVGFGHAFDPEKEIPRGAPAEIPSGSVQAIRDSVHRIGGGGVNDVSHARRAVELEELLVRRPRLHESISACQRHHEVDALPVLRQCDGAEAGLRATTAVDMATGEIEGDCVGWGY